MIKRLFKWLMFLCLVVLVLLLIAVGVAYYFAGTDSGFKYTTQEVVQRIAGLEIEGSSGNLKEGISANSLTYSDNAIVVQASNIETKWRSGCLLDREFCLDKVFIDDLYLEPKATESSNPPPPADRITLPPVSLPLSLNAEEIFVKTLRLKLPGVENEHVLHDVALQASTRDSTVKLKSLSARYENVSVELNGKFQLEGDYPLDAQLKIIAEDVLEDHDVNVGSTLGGSLANLELDAAISGAATLKLSGTIQPLEKSFPADLTLQSDSLGWPLDTQAIALAQYLNIRLNGDLSDYAVSVATTISGESIPQSDISLTGLVNTERLLLPDTTVLTMGGFATGSTALSWANDLTWFAEVIAKDIDPSLQIPDLTGSLNGLVKASGSVVNGQWSLDVKKANVDGELSGFPLTLESTLKKSLDNVWQVRQFNLQNGRNSVVAAGSLDDSWKVDAQIELPELQNFLPGLAGGFSIDANVGGKRLKPDVTLNASSTVFKFDSVLVQGAKLNADIKSDATQQSNLKLTLGDVTANGQKFRNTRFVIDGTQQEHTMTLFTDGPQKTAIDLTATGGLSETFNWLGSLRRVKLEVPAHDIQLAKATEVEWNNETKQLRVEPHCWVSLDTRLCLDNQLLAASAGAAKLSLSNYAMNRLDPFLPANSTVKGELSATSTLLWGEEQPGGFSASLSSRVNKGGFSVSDDAFEEVTFNYESFSLDVNADGNQVSSKILVDSTKLGRANIALNLDPKDENRPINGTVNLTGFDIGFVQAFLPELDKVAGKLNANGKVTGNLSDPRFDGNVSLSNPVIQSAALPLSIDGGKLDAKINDKRAFISGTMASGEGLISLKGNANWNRSPWRVNMDISGENLAVIQPPVESSEVHPKIKLRAQPGSIRITGSIDIPKAKINVQDLPQGAVTLSDDVIVVEDQFEADAFKSIEVQESATKLNVAVNVTLGEEVDLRAYGLEANLQGDIKVSIDSPNPPQLGGEIRVVEGVYKQYGQDLAVSDGQILFVGPIDQTRLNIDAVREIESEERIAGMRLQGPIAEPEVTLFTEPADKPQESILSYIVLGRDISEASDQESNLLASAALALTLKGSRGTATSVAEKIGIQDFELDARGDGDDTEVVISGRLNDRLLLRYGQSVFQPESTLYLRYDISRQLYLEAAQGVEQAVDLFYSFSF